MYSSFMSSALPSKPQLTSQGMLLQVLKREGFEDNNLIKEKVTAEDIAKAVLQQLRVDLHPGLVNLDDTEIGELGEGEVPLRILLKDRSHAHLRLSVVPTSV